MKIDLISQSKLFRRGGFFTILYNNYIQIFIYIQNKKLNILNYNNYIRSVSRFIILTAVPLKYHLPFFQVKNYVYLPKIQETPFTYISISISISNFVSPISGDRV